MGLNINFWNCKFSDYTEEYNEEECELYRLYNCTHKKGDGTCDIDNKFNDETAFCKLAENKQS